MKPKTRQYTALPATKRNADGVKVCCWCEGALSGRQQRWCSKACVDEYLASSSQAGVRKAVAKRDRGVCAGCGFQAERVELILRALRGLSLRRVNERREQIQAGDPDARLMGTWDGKPHYGYRYVSDPHPSSARRSEQLQLAIVLVNAWLGREVVKDHAGLSLEIPTLWEADHIVPFAEGGAPGPENCRTLCLRCHRAETAALAARLAAARRPPDPQLRLLSEG